MSFKGSEPLLAFYDFSTEYWVSHSSFLKIVLRQLYPSYDKTDILQVEICIGDF